eukprot:scaffold89360_cov36-Phaeocystis_antarctica.AAC.2
MVSLDRGTTSHQEHAPNPSPNPNPSPSPSSNPSSTLSLAPNPTQAASCCYGRTARTTTLATAGSDPRSRCRWASP